MLLEGLYLPLITPFYLDGSLNLRKLEHNVHRYSKTPVAGMIVLGEHGEPSLLSEAEIEQALRAAIETAEPEKVMLAGIARESVVESVRVAELAADLGYDAVVVSGPRMLATGDRLRELRTYFQAVADQSRLPVVIASSAACPLSVELIAELAQHRNVIGLVDTPSDAARILTLKAATAQVQRDVTVTQVFAAVTGRMMKLRDESAGSTFVSAESLSGGGAALAVAPPMPTLKTRTKKIGFQILAGSTAGMLDALKAGATGAAPAFAACAPQATYEVVAAWKDGDENLAKEKQARVQEAADRIEVALGVPAIRFACDLNGYFGGRPRLPLLPPTGAEREEMEALMQGIRN